MKIATPLDAEEKELKYAACPHSAWTTFSIFLVKCVSWTQIIENFFFLRWCKTSLLFRWSLVPKPWVFSDTELCKVVEEFKGVKNELDELPHHQEGRASQRRFLCHVRDLIDVILMNGNPFEEQLRGLVSLADRVCESSV